MRECFLNQLLEKDRNTLTHILGSRHGRLLLVNPRKKNRAFQWKGMCHVPQTSMETGHSLKSDETLSCDPSPYDLSC